MVGIPGSSVYIGRNAGITWRRHGRLFILRPGDAPSGVGVTGEMWHLNPAGQASLARDAVYPISLASENQPGSPAQLDDGRLAFAMPNASSTDYLERGRYALPLDTFVPRKLIGLPPAAWPRAL